MQRIHYSHSRPKNTIFRQNYNYILEPFNSGNLHSSIKQHKFPDRQRNRFVFDLIFEKLAKALKKMRQ